MRQALHIVCSTCLGVCIVGITSCQYEMSSPPPEENNWETYEDMSESAHLAAGKCVFVFVYSEINAMSLPAFNAFNDSNFQRLCKGNAYVLLLLKYNDWSDLRLRHIARTIGFTKQPYVVLFSPDGETVALDPLTLKRLRLER